MLENFDIEDENDVIGPFYEECGFLSNLHRSPFIYKGKIWQTSEHAYQAMKTKDEDEQEHVRSQTTPGRAKRAGQKVTLRDDWEDVKVGIMKDILREKFSDPKLQGLLLKTDPKPLVEINYWGDRFYGVCEGKGFNVLGQILMEIREELKET